MERRRLAAVFLAIATKSVSTRPFDPDSVSARPTLWGATASQLTGNPGGLPAMGQYGDVAGPAGWQSSENVVRMGIWVAAAERQGADRPHNRRRVMDWTARNKRRRPAPDDTPGGRVFSQRHE
jgi:hypothetical protein